jgi:glycine cleavage system T protein (aminomethyltransferase)
VAQGLKRTPLFPAHRRAGAKMVEFAGWDMPVQYQGVIEEHRAVRSRAGLFDVSHMGEIEVRGDGAIEFCQRTTANDVSRMNRFQAQYNLLLNEHGGIIDDVIFYRLEENIFFICVNASNSDKDFAWLRAHVPAKIEVENVSAKYAQLALQGPRAEKILQLLTGARLPELKSFYFVFADVASIRCLVARTGYTGEDGFELYCNSDDAMHLWAVLLETGGPEGLVPVGLGARDTLRLEKAYPLYGHELDDTTTPLEAGLGWVTKFSKPNFIGREFLIKQKERGVERKLAGLEMLEPGIARAGYCIFKDDIHVGGVTSGTKSPSLGKSIALGYVGVEHAALGNIVAVEIRNRKVPAKIVSLPFYSR